MGQAASSTDFALDATDFIFDAFVSYSRSDEVEMKMIVEAIQRKFPCVRLYIDKQQHQPGVFWQQQMFEAIDKSRKVICMLSPSYISSKVCMEEYNIALLRHREPSSVGGVLVPVYIKTVSKLPTYMRLIQYEDLRDAFHSDNKSELDDAVVPITRLLLKET